MRQVKTLGLLGTGVIGGGWAARALHFGIDVVASDVRPEMEGWIRGAVDNAAGALSVKILRAASSATEAGTVRALDLKGLPLVETSFAFQST